MKQDYEQELETLIHLADYITNTRLNCCLTFNCKNNDKIKGTCLLKKVVLVDGSCQMFKKDDSLPGKPQ